MGQSPSKRILLIDGDQAVQDCFRRIFRFSDVADSAAGISPRPSVLEHLDVDTAVDGPEGWRQFEKALHQGRPYLLAVVGQPLDGAWDSVETVLQLWQEDPTLPVLLCIGNQCTAEDRHEMARRLGKLDQFMFLSKPLDTDLARQMVASQADRRLARDELQKVTKELGRALERAQDEAEMANRAKNEFMANITHEIRTPMNAILGFTRLLMKEPLTDGQLEKLHYVRDAGTSLMDLISNVLDFSKLAAGQLELSSTTFDLDAIFTDVLDATHQRAREKGLAIQHHVANGVPRRLRGDKTRFRQILVNLVSNAVKFTDYGTVHIQTALDEETSRSATLRITVTDTGVGIPVHRQPIIFESFCQADGSSTRKFEGAGLGLSICKQLVDLMGGQIGFRSDPGEGSSFWLTLTFEKHVARDPGTSPPGGHKTPADRAAEGPPDESSGAQGGKPHVLV
ncbi:hypothetical protein LCGC14_2107620, partial [marine sediment metagenome]